MIGCYSCGAKPKKQYLGGVTPCDQYAWYEVEHKTGCKVKFREFPCKKKDKKKWYNYNYYRTPRLRFGMTEEELANLTPEQAKRLEDFWIPMKRVIYPKFICKDLLIIDPNDPTKLITKPSESIKNEKYK